LSMTTAGVWVAMLALFFRRVQGNAMDAVHCLGAISTSSL